MTNFNKLALKGNTTALFFLLGCLIPSGLSAQTVGVQVLAQIGRESEQDPAKQAMAYDYLRALEEVLLNAGFERGMITFNLPPVLGVSGDKTSELSIKDYANFFSQIRSGGGQRAWVLQLELHIEPAPLRCLASSFDLSTYDLGRGMVTGIGRVSLASNASAGDGASELGKQISQALDAISGQ